MLLRGLQELLASVYDTGLPADVLDYLVTDPVALRELEPAPARTMPEKLLLSEAGEELGLALYLDPELVDRLHRSDPRERLCAENLADFCTVIEGISHFQYVAWNATRDQRITLLELELQAEIDKYITARLLLEQQQDATAGRTLHKHLFDDPDFAADLEPEELTRYRDASAFAGRYCRSLESRFPAARIPPGMLHELRRFYRLPQPAKVSRIRSLPVR